MPRDVLPRDGVPGHQQARGILCCGASPRTHSFPLPHPGPPSAYPGRSPGLWLLRASFAPGACRWHRLGEVTPSRRATGGSAVPSSHGLPLEDGAVHRVGRQCRPVSGTGCRRLLLCHVGSSVSASGAGCRARWRNHPFAGAVHGCLRDGIPGVRLPGSAVAPRFRPLRARRRPGGEAVTPAPGGRGLHPHAALRSKVHHHLAVSPEAVASCYVNLQEKKKTLPVSGTSHRFLHFPLCTFRCVLPRHADAFATIASFSAERPVIRGRGRSHASRCLFVRDQETFCASHFRPCWQ